MKKYNTALIASVALAIASGSTQAAGNEPFVKQRLLVRFKASTSEAKQKDILRGHGAHIEREISEIRVKIIKLPASGNERALAAAIQRQEGVEFAEVDPVYRSTATPTDALYPSQWHLPRIAAPEAWDLHMGSASIIIAILDSGIDPNHPDLRPILVPGRDIATGGSDTSDVHGHGTAVAGMVAASTNDQGIAGTSWYSRLMPVRVSDSTGYTTGSKLASGLTWAADNGARVANMSFQADQSATVASAAQYFYNKGGVVTVSSGNAGGLYSYPDSPYMVTVGASRSDDALAGFSNRGPNIDVVAPGEGVYTAASGGGHRSASGTSFAAPLTAGVAALILSANPALTAGQVHTILRNSADDLGTPGFDTSFGYGRVNAARAVQMALDQEGGDRVAPTVSFTYPNPGATLSGTANLQVSASDDVGVVSVTLAVNGTNYGSFSGGSSFALNTLLLANGAYTLTAIAKDAAGNTGTSSVSVQIFNAADTTAPEVRITSPASGGRVAKNNTIKGVASDNSGSVSRVELLVNGKLMASTTSASFSFRVSDKKFTSGANTVLVRAFDAAGNRGEASITLYK